MISRRNFLRKAGFIAGASLNLPFTERSISTWFSSSFQIVFVEPEEVNRTVSAATARRGVTLGVEEVTRVGELLGRSVEWDVITEEKALTGSLGPGRPTALIGGFDRDSCLGLADVAEETGCMFVNIGCKDDGLRGPDCRRSMIHIQASQSMYADAVGIFRSSEPEPQVAGQIESVLWHRDLFRYGAAQLNQRFLHRFGIGMDGPAWAGWMGVKVLWEAATRARSHTIDDITAYLSNSSTRFDGHKGWPLSFRIGGQLRQPLYLIDASDSVISEVPVQGSDDRSAREILDEIGRASRGSGSRSGCRIPN